MNYGPLIFLAAFLAMAGSWFGFVITPQAQMGRQQPANTLGTPLTYPVLRPGLARQGLQVYRANGCAECHSQQVRQSGTRLEVVLKEPGTNQATVLVALRKLDPGMAEADARRLLTTLPKPVLTVVSRPGADAALKALTDAGAKASLSIVPTGQDLDRGWGRRRTVAEDFLYDNPVLLGAQRVGPDLANAGVRLPDLNWQLCHLYWPRSEVKESYMPACQFLFEKLPAGPARSPDALVFPAGAQPYPGFEIVPKPEAKALAAYLLSLRADAPLFEAPITPPATAAAATNAPAASGSPANSPAANPPKTS